jgi:hypothetical protein
MTCSSVVNQSRAKDMMGTNLVPAESQVAVS